MKFLAYKTNTNDYFHLHFFFFLLQKIAYDFILAYRSPNPHHLPHVYTIHTNTTKHTHKFAHMRIDKILRSPTRLPHSIYSWLSSRYISKTYFLLQSYVNHANH